jgi:hypothetical protein
MKISEVIESLKRELEQYGDVEVEYCYDENMYNVYCSVGYIMYESDRNTIVFT